MEVLIEFLNTLLYSENIRTHINALASLKESVERSTEVVEKIEKAAEVLFEAVHLLKKTLEKSCRT